MKAIVSGQLGMALVLQKGTLELENDDHVPSETRSIDVVADLLHEATDAILVDMPDIKEINAELERAWRRDRGLQLILNLLDAELSRATRMSSAEALVEIWDEDVETFVSNRLYSAQLPLSADDKTAVELLQDCRGESVVEVLMNVVHLQASISERLAAWEALPYVLFGGPAEKAAFKREAIGAGAFRLFVSEKRGNLALFQLLVHERFRGDARARVVFQKWAEPFREGLARTDFSRTGEEEEEAEHRGRRRNPMPARVALARVSKQKDAIKELLQLGQRELALRYTRELVHSQRQDDEEFAAKSLCDLSQFAKQLGNLELQREFAEWATQEASNDAWSFAQLGDALRGLGEFTAAQVAYHRAGVLGDPRVAMVGQGQILKDLGQLDEALAMFDACAARFPGDPVAKNARASALADFGRLRESLSEYEELLKYDAYSVVTRSGKAQVLRELGRYDEALRDLDGILRHNPNATVPAIIRAEVLRETGQLNDALASFQAISRSDPLDPVSRNGVATVLRELGRIPEALEEFEAIVSTFPWHMTAYMGIASTYKTIGDLAEALNRYDEVMRRFRSPMPARVGKAAVLAGLQQYAEALNLLPNYLPATKSDWAAYHVRGMVHLRRGELNLAETILERGASESPWIDERGIFSAALAAARIRKERFAEAIELLGKPAPANLGLVVRILSIHAHGALGNRDEVEASLAKSWQGASRPVLLLKEQLTRKYGGSVGTPHDTGFEAMLFDRESEFLLLAA